MAAPPPSVDRRAVARRVFVVLILVLVLPLTWLRAVDGTARRYVETGLQRALVTYATARAAGGVISVLRGTAVDLTPMGVGVTTTPGEILDPLHDLLEEFSALMLVACVSFGIQEVFVSI